MRVTFFVQAVLGLAFLSVTIASGPDVSLGEFFGGALANLSRPTPWGDPLRGMQDYYHCCLVAVNDSLEINNGNLTFRPGQTALRGTLDDFLANPFPCGTVDDGSDGYPPQVWISWSWCNQNCPGWAMTWIDNYSLKLWLQPLVTFISPAAVFCLNIPRRRRLDVPRRFFPRRLNSLPQILTLIYKVPIAALIVTFDLIIWTMIALTFAGPMLLSGLYEALLDVRLLKYLRNRMRRNSLTVRQRAHLLLVILFGSLDLDPAWDESKHILAGLPHDSLRRRFSSITSNNGSTLPTSPIGHSPHEKKGSVSSFRSSKRRQISAEYSLSEQGYITAMKTRLKAAIESQTGFGSAVGAAIVFYVGNFAYTLIQLQVDYGQVDLSHQLAFGMMWMAIPHIAIISSLLLACNNPNIWTLMISSFDQISQHLEAVQEGGSISEDTQHKRVIGKPFRLFWYKVYTPVYGHKHNTSWIWRRGETKARWIRKFSEEYTSFSTSIENEVLLLSIKSLLISICLPAFFLVLVPAFLGALISYTTPAVGLGCRSLTLLTWTCAQLLLMFLWVLNLSTVPSEKETQHRNRLFSYFTYIGPVAWSACFFLGLLASFLTGIMGTIFVMMSLYSNCLCSTPAVYWPSRWTNPKAVFYLGSFSNEQVWYAKHYWANTGIAAICFLIGMTYIGWWYSRRTRYQFCEYTDSMDFIDEEDGAENNS